MSEIERVANPTIEEAIKYLEGMIFTQDFHPSTLMAKAVITMAIEALREKQARSQGCDYCLKTHPKHNGHSHIWHGNMLDIGYGVYLDINYCPKCGRKLTANVEIRFA